MTTIINYLYKILNNIVARKNNQNMNLKVVKALKR